MNTANASLYAGYLQKCNIRQRRSRDMAFLLPVQQAQKFFPRFCTGPHAPKHAACSRSRAGFLNASHHHAQVAGLHHHRYPLIPVNASRKADTPSLPEASGLPQSQVPLAS